MHRSIILTKGKKYWVYEDLFAKKDLDNISDDDLGDFRRLAKVYESLTPRQISAQRENGDFVEICHDDKN